MLRSSKPESRFLSLARLALMAAFMALMALPVAANADSITGRHVTDIGCEQANCYFTFDGAAANGLAGTTCPAAANEFRWDGTTAAGKLIYASLMSAYLTGKTVMVFYNACYGAYGGTYLTIEYFHISG